MSSRPAISPSPATSITPSDESFFATADLFCQRPSTSPTRPRRSGTRSQTTASAPGCRSSTALNGPTQHPAPAAYAERSGSCGGSRSTRNSTSGRTDNGSGSAPSRSDPASPQPGQNKPNSTHSRRRHPADLHRRDQLANPALHPHPRIPDTSRGNPLPPDARRHQHRPTITRATHQPTSLTNALSIDLGRRNPT